MPLHQFTPDQQHNAVVVIKLGWFLVATVGRYIKTGNSFEVESIVEANHISKTVDEFLKELK